MSSRLYIPSWLIKLILLLFGVVLLFITMDIMLGELSLLSLATSIFAAPVGFNTNLSPLRFTAQGTFQLSIFEDLHYGEGEDTTWGPQHDIESTGVMNTVLDSESPQLVVLNGDLITGENTFLENSTAYVSQIVAPLVQRSLPWASTYGNHDSNYNISTYDILATESTYPNSYTQNMVGTANPDSGVSNYYLPVFSATADSSTSNPAAFLWFFDSRGGQYYQQLDPSGNTIQEPGWVDQSVVDWFTATKASLNAKYSSSLPIPSVVFVHIPIYAFAAFQTAGVSSTQEPGINDDNPLAPQSIENNVYTGHDIPFMQALLDTPGLIAVFSGHDHGDDWCAKWDSQLPGMNLVGNGLDLCFGRHSGYGGYGTWTRGSRQVLLNIATPGEVQTWVRLETGEVSGSVSLNGTYGVDQYPPVSDTYTGN